MAFVALAEPPQLHAPFLLQIRTSVRRLALHKIGTSSNSLGFFPGRFKVTHPLNFEPQYTGNAARICGVLHVVSRGIGDLA